MTPLARATSAVDRFFFGDTVTVGVVLYRRFLALWTFLFFLPRVPHAYELYARPILRQTAKPWRMIGDPIPPLWLVHLALGVLLVLLVVMMVSSRWARLAHVALLVPLSFLFAVDTVMPRAYGGLAYFQWWLLLLAPYERAVDDDGVLAARPAVGLRLLQLQFCAVYFYAVFSKLLDGGGWVDGTAVYNAFNSVRYGKHWLSSWGITRPLAFLFAWGTILGEAFVPFGLWARRTRGWAMLTVVGLHVSMGACLAVSLHFHFLMVGHLLLFIPASWWERVTLLSLPTAAADPAR